MRVTNEQAKWLKEYDRLEDIRNLSADLLEARELIKEMREQLEEIIQQHICEPCCMSGLSRCNTCEGSCDVVRDHKDLLEESKEYAESYNRQKRNTHPLKEGKTRGDVKPFTYSKKPNKPSKGQK